MKKVLYNSKYLKVTYRKGDIFNLIYLILLSIFVIQNDVLYSMIFMFLILLNRISQIENKEREGK